MPIVLILDCGATNIRAIAINEVGQIIASHYQTNHSDPDPYFPQYHIWDFDKICNKLFFCIRQVVEQLTEKQIPLKQISACAITTFGVDGTIFNKEKQPLYPVISWKCSRTLTTLQQVKQEFDLTSLYQRNGIGEYSFNTLFKLHWLQQHQPERYSQTDKFLFISSMLAYRLTGVMTSDRTMVGTSMMTNLHTGYWDQSVLDFLQLTTENFPPLVNAGETIGYLTEEIAKLTGLPSGIPVISAGHDTQFAILGSGAEINQPVLSSGTWEILMVRTANTNPNPHYIANGLTTEFDAQQGLFNPAVQWLGSGILEWLGKLLYQDVIDKPNYYATMIAEAEKIPAGSNNLFFSGSFSTAEYQTDIGKLLGLSIHTSRGQIYRAALEFMAHNLRQGLTILEQECQFKTKQILCVGGGSKNHLWNQIRADITGIPIKVLQLSEATVLGAAMTAFYGIHYYKDLLSAQQAMTKFYTSQTFYPQIPLSLTDKGE